MNVQTITSKQFEIIEAAANAAIEKVPRLHRRKRVKTYERAFAEGIAIYAKVRDVKTIVGRRAIWTRNVNLCNSKYRDDVRVHEVDRVKRVSSSGKSWSYSDSYHARIPVSDTVFIWR